MKEKDIKEILDDKFESMAPDLVNKICENKIEKIKDESELFGNDEPLFRIKLYLVVLLLLWWRVL